MSELRASDVTDEHIGMQFSGIDAVAGWAPYLVLQYVRDDDQGKIVLGFRWNDDPSPANTERGKFAYGVHLDPDHRVTVHD